MATENLPHASSGAPWGRPSITWMFSVSVLVAMVAFAQMSFAASSAPEYETIPAAASPSNRNASNAGGSKPYCGSVAPKGGDSSDQGQLDASNDAAAGDYDDEAASQDASGHDDQTRVRALRTESAEDESGCKPSNSEGTQSDLRPSQQTDADGDSDADNDASDNDASSEGRPTLETQYEHYSDSEHANTSTFNSTTTVPFDDFLLTLRKQTVWARDSIGSQRSDAIAVSVHRDLNEIFGVTGELGRVRTFQLNGLMGSFQAEANYRGATISASVGRNVLAESAETLRANLWQTDFELNASYKLTKRLSSELEFHHKLYSDRNSSNELDWSPQYLFDPFGSKLAVGYHFSYIGFARTTDHGYWAPRLALSHSAFVNWSYDWTKVFSRLELELGRGLVRESNTEAITHGYNSSVKAVLGLRPTENTAIEYSLSTDRSPGWSSTSSGLNLKYTFY